MKIHVWCNSNGYFPSRPAKPARVVEVEFDPDQPCRQCGNRVLSISVDNSDVCLWCDSGTNRPKILRYQEDEIVRLLKKQSEENELAKAGKRPRVANRSTEKDVRDYLSDHGYFGASARFLRLELAAIERPGWVQTFDFHIQVKTHSGDWVSRFGHCRTDERFNSFEVSLFDREGDLNQALLESTQGMITHRRESSHWSLAPLMLLFSLVVTAAAIGAVLTPAPFPESAAPQTIATPVESDAID